MGYTPEQAKAALAIVQVVAECIKDATEMDAQRGIPSGHLYAMLLTLPGMTLNAYERIIGILVESGRVARAGDFLSWKNAA